MSSEHANLMQNLKIAPGDRELNWDILGHCVVHRTSYRAALLMDTDLPLETLFDPNKGYYLGSQSTHGVPHTRDSQEYWATPEGAADALERRSWAQRT